MIRRTKAPSAESTFGLVGGLLALLAAATLALALAPTSALAVGGEQKVLEPPTMGYTTMKVVGEVKEDFTHFSFVAFEIVKDPSEFSSNVGQAEVVYNGGANVHVIEKEFTGLKPGTTYYVRINVGGGEERVSNVVSGTTLPVAAPKVLSVDAPSSVSYTSVHLSGEVEGVEGPDPVFASDCRFEYVSDADFKPRSEVEELSVRASGGTFQLYYNGEPTTSLAYNASAASVQAALEALPGIGAGDVSVSGGPGDATGSSPYTIAFQGALAGKGIEQIYVEPSNLTPSGGSGAEVQTVVDGHGEQEFGAAASVPCDVNPVTTSGATAVAAGLEGLAAGTTYHFRLSISNGGGSDSEAGSNFTTLAVAPPTVLSVDAAANVRYTQADLRGEVERPAGADPAFDVNCRFEYVPAEQFLSSGFQFAGQTPCAENPVTGAGGNVVTAHLEGLSVGTTYYYRLVAENAGGKDVVRASNPFTTLVPDAPEVSIFPVDEVGTHTAHFSGEINPGDTDPGFSVSWHFECTPACPGLEGTIPADEADHLISVEATGLKANTLYEVTLVASNAAKTASAGPVAFTTDMAEPVVTTFPAFALVGGTQALVGGTIDAENAPTTYWIEYGPTAGYGSSIPVSKDGEVGSGDDPVFFQQKLTGLVPGAEYHFRLVADNGAGSVAGNDETFVTPTGDLGSAIGEVGLPDNRTWEMVSPPAKNSADVWKAYVAASPDGQAVSYKSQGSFAGLPTAKGGNLADYIARRGGEGWVNKGLTPQGGLFCFVCGAVEMSADKSFARFNWRERGTESPDKELELDPSQIESVTRQYLRNNQTDTFKRLPNPYGIEALGNAMSADGSHIAVTTEENLTDEAPCDTGSTPCVYESLDHGFSWRLVSVLPDENPTQAGMLGMSEDGSRIYFRGGGDIYVRVDGSSTTQVAGGAVATIAAIEGPTGSRVLLRTPEALLPADEDPEMDLYVWDGSKAPAEQLTLVSQGDIPGVEANLGEAIGYRQDQSVSQGLDRGFFVASNQILAGQPDAAGQKIYAWEATGSQPTLAYVATVNNLADTRTSPNGRFLVLVSTDRLTAYDNEGVQEVYRYDQGTDRLVCVSCDPEGRKQTRESRLSYISPQEGAFGIGHELRNVDDKGDVFFESLEGLVNHDSNGVSDVYEYQDGLPRLLSKGTGPHQSRFADASVSGNDVFILTDDQLVGWDVDRSYDVYDARVGGGLPEPPPPGIPCEGDSCQPVPNPPNDPTPASENFNGAGNVKPAKKKHHHKKHRKHHRKKHHGKKQSTRKNG